MRKIKKITKIFFCVILILSFCLLTLTGSFGSGLFAEQPKIKVFIDPGHGGADPGAIGFGYYEKTANLDIALRVKSKLEASGFAVIMRRTDDSYRTLDEIVSMANKSGADIFVSIHNNASISPYAHGTETYWCANGVAGSNQLASLIQSYVLKQTGRANRGVKTANFRVIKYTTMPAALVECAFISNQTECDLLRSADFREKCAAGIAGAIAKFSEGIIKPSGSGGSTSGGTDDKDKGKNNYSDVSTPDSSGFSLGINFPPNNSTVADQFVLRGWSADLRNSPAKKVIKVEVYKGSGRLKENLLGSIVDLETNVLGSQGVLQGGWQFIIDCDKLDEGENILYIHAYDKKDNYSTGNVKVNVLKSGNVPDNLNLNPAANPGGPYKGEIGKDIELDGSYSYDPDGIISEYLWDFGDGETSTDKRPVHAYGKAGNYTVTLTVKDNGGKLSSPALTSALVIDPSADQGSGDQDTGAPKLGNVSNSTIIIGYIDIPEEALLKIFADRNSRKLDRAKKIAPLYLKYGKLFNLRADIAWAQMCHETGFLEFTGDVKPGQNNFCGLGATGGGVPGHSFATEELGVIAHYAHIAWYYYPGHVNEYCNKNYDPRHFGDGHTNYTGNTTLGFMNGRWAPGATYTDKIILFANQIIQAIGPDVEIKSSVTANAGQDKQGVIGESIKFDASASIIKVIGDADISYSWDWDGDGKFDKTVDTAVVKHAFQSPGIFKVTLKILLSDGAESTDTIKVEINDIPVADPGGPYKGFVNEAVILDGSGSSDPDGKIIEYVWDFGDGTTGDGEKPQHIYAEPGKYKIKLKVRDDKGAGSTEESTSVVIEVKSSEEDIELNNAPTADPGGPYTGITGEYVTMDGSKSEDTDGEILEYLWDFGDGTTGSGINPSHIFQEPGEFIVELTVVDDKGLSSTTVSTNVEIINSLEKDDLKNNEYENTEVAETTETAITTGAIETEETGSQDGSSTQSTEVTASATTNIENEPPVADAGGPYTGEVKKAINFDGSGSKDPDGDITKYIWDFGDGDTGSGKTPEHSYSKAGDYTVKLVVKDDDGAESATEETTVKIKEKQYPVNTSIITNSTGFVGYYEVTVDQLVNLFVKRGSGKVEWARRLAPMYITYGKMFNLRADIAWAQMCHETGFLEFTGDVKPGQNNFVGLGATGGGVPGHSFATEELGVIAHYAHLAWYYYPEHINQYCNSTYDPRHYGTTHSKYTGDTSIGFLNGRWAPGSTYTDKILQFANQIYGL